MHCLMMLTTCRVTVRLVSGSPRLVDLDASSPARDLILAGLIHEPLDELHLSSVARGVWKDAGIETSTTSICVAVGAEELDDLLLSVGGVCIVAVR